MKSLVFKFFLGLIVSSVIFLTFTLVWFLRLESIPWSQHILKIGENCRRLSVVDNSSDNNELLVSRRLKMESSFYSFILKIRRVEVNYLLFRVFSAKNYTNNGSEIVCWIGSSREVGGFSYVIYDDLVKGFTLQKVYDETWK